MSEMSDEWLKNCIKYNANLNIDDSFASEMYRKELKYREENGIFLQDTNYYI